MACDPTTNAACFNYATPTPTFWPTPTPTPDVPNLPMTGMNIVLIAIIVIALLAAGFALRYATRNRTTT